MEIQTNKFSVRTWITLHKGTGGIALPLDFDWTKNRYCDTSFILNIHILFFQISVYYDGNR